MIIWTQFIDQLPVGLLAQSQRSWVQIPYGSVFQVLFTTTRFSSVLSCEDLLISFMEIVFENVNLIDIFSRITF